MNPWQSGQRSDAKPVTITFDGVTFEPPPGWQENSSLNLARPGRKPRPTLSLNRVSERADVTLETHVSRQLAELSAAMPLHVFETKEARAAGCRAIEMLMAFPIGEASLLLQRIAFVKTPDAVWVLSASSTEQDAPQLSAEFEHALATLRLPEVGPR
jgi:hypothetical protein